MNAPYRGLHGGYCSSVRGFSDDSGREGGLATADLAALIAEGRFGRPEVALRRLDALVPGLEHPTDPEPLLLALDGRAALLHQLGEHDDAIAACDQLESAARARQHPLWATAACALRAQIRVETDDFATAMADVAQADVELEAVELDSPTGFRILEALATVYARLRLTDRLTEIRERLENGIAARTPLEQATHWTAWSLELALRALEPVAAQGADPEPPLMAQATDLAARVTRLPEDATPSRLRRTAQGVRALAAAYAGRSTEALRLLGQDAFGNAKDLPVVERQLVTLAAMRTHAVLGALATARSLDEGTATACQQTDGMLLEVCRARVRLWLESLSGEDTTPVLVRLTGQLARLAWHELDRTTEAAGRSLEHHTMHPQNRTDALTGVANRSVLDEDLRQMLRFGSLPMALVLVDVDDFRALNERFSRVVGDEVLRRVAGSLSQQLRTGDEEAHNVAGRMAAAIADRPWYQLADGLRVSVTTGCAAVWSLTGRRPDADAERLFRRAEEALAQAQRRRPHADRPLPTPAAGAPAIIDLTGREPVVHSARRPAGRESAAAEAAQGLGARNPGGVSSVRPGPAQPQGTHPAPTPPAPAPVPTRPAAGPGLPTRAPVDQPPAPPRPAATVRPAAGEPSGTPSAPAARGPRTGPEPIRSFPDQVPEVSPTRGRRTGAEPPSSSPATASPYPPGHATQSPYPSAAEHAGRVSGRPTSPSTPAWGGAVPSGPSMRRPDPLTDPLDGDWDDEAGSLVDQYRDGPLDGPYRQVPLGDGHRQVPLGDGHRPDPLGDRYHDDPLDGPYRQVPLGDGHRPDPLGDRYHDDPLSGAYRQDPLGYGDRDDPLGDRHREDPLSGPYRQVPLGYGHRPDPLGDRHHDDPLSGAYRQDPLGYGHRDERQGTPSRTGAGNRPARTPAPWSGDGQAEGREATRPGPRPARGESTAPRGSSGDLGVRFGDSSAGRADDPFGDRVPWPGAEPGPQGHRASTPYHGEQPPTAKTSRRSEGPGASLSGYPAPGYPAPGYPASEEDASGYPHSEYPSEPASWPIYTTPGPLESSLAHDPLGARVDHDPLEGYRDERRPSSPRAEEPRSRDKRRHLFD